VLQSEQAAADEAARRKLAENCQLLAEVAELRRSKKEQAEQLLELGRQLQQAQAQVRAAQRGGASSPRQPDRPAEVSGSSRCSPASGVAAGGAAVRQSWSEGMAAGGWPGVSAAAGARPSGSRCAAGSSASQVAGPGNASAADGSTAVTIGSMKLERAPAVPAGSGGGGGAAVRRPLSAAASGALKPRRVSSSSLAAAAGKVGAAPGPAWAGSGSRPSTAGSLLGAAAGDGSSGGSVKAGGGRSLQAMMLEELSSWRKP
jgi:hypothetical protein